MSLTGVQTLRAETQELPVPRPVADFHLEAYAGQVVLLDFWASWCGPCRQSLPWLASMQEKYGAEGLQVVAVNLDRDAAAPRAMIASLPAAVAQFLDPAGSLAEKFKLEAMPSSFLYDRQGALITAEVGFVQADGPKREALLQSALARKEQP